MILQPDNAQTAFVLGLGLLLGLKHATDADHVVAMTAFLSEQRSLLRSSWTGVFWGLGHTTTLLAVGSAVILLNLSIPEWIVARAELLVAGMLVFLGGRLVLRSWRRRFELHKHSHVHHAADGGHAHSHWHIHAASATPHAHDHSTWAHFGLRPFVVGAVHGVAGSGALMLLVLGTIRSALEGVAYILVFGFGSIAGMFLVSLLIALPLQWAQKRLETSYKPIELAAGLLSCAFGIYLGVSVFLP